MQKIAIVTDSTAYIPKDLVNKYNIRIIPQVLIWGDEIFLDGVDIQPREFYSRLENANVMPTSSQATVASFIKIFGDLVEQEYQIIAILISSQLSGTIDSATKAREMFPDATIEIINSNSTAMAMGFQVLSVARAIEEGENFEDCISISKEAVAHTGVLFAVNTLEFLHRGGRIGGANRLLGTALNIKPILELKDGHVEPVEKVRTRKKSINRMLDMVEERIQGDHPIHLSVLHANAHEEARDLINKINGQFNAVENVLSEVSPVVGTHTGPGTIGLAYMSGM